MTGQKANSLENITWSELIKQTIQMQAKYSLRTEGAWTQWAPATQPKLERSV